MAKNQTVGRFEDLLDENSAREWEGVRLDFRSRVILVGSCHLDVIDRFSCLEDLIEELAYLAATFVRASLQRDPNQRFLADSVELNGRTRIAALETVENAGVPISKEAAEHAVDRGLERYMAVVYGLLASEVRARGIEIQPLGEGQISLEEREAAEARVRRFYTQLGPDACRRIRRKLSDSGAAATVEFRSDWFSPQANDSELLQVEIERSERASIREAERQASLMFDVMAAEAFPAFSSRVDRIAVLDFLAISILKSCKSKGEPEERVHACKVALEERRDHWMCQVDDLKASAPGNGEDINGTVRQPQSSGYRTQPPRALRLYQEMGRLRREEGLVGKRIVEALDKNPQYSVRDLPEGLLWKGQAPTFVRLYDHAEFRGAVRKFVCEKSKEYADPEAA